DHIARCAFQRGTAGFDASSCLSDDYHRLDYFLGESRVRAEPDSTSAHYRHSGFIVSPGPVLTATRGKLFHVERRHPALTGSRGQRTWLTTRAKTLRNWTSPASQIRNPEISDWSFRLSNASVSMWCYWLCPTEENALTVGAVYDRPFFLDSTKYAPTAWSTGVCERPLPPSAALPFCKGRMSCPPCKEAMLDLRLESGNEALRVLAIDCAALGIIEQLIFRETLNGFGCRTQWIIAPEEHIRQGNQFHKRRKSSRMVGLRDLVVELLQLRGRAVLQPCVFSLNCQSFEPAEQKRHSAAAMGEDETDIRKFCRRSAIHQARDGSGRIGGVFNSRHGNPRNKPGAAFWLRGMHVNNRRR